MTKLLHLVLGSIAVRDEDVGTEVAHFLFIFARWMGVVHFL